MLGFEDTYTDETIIDAAEQTMPPIVRLNFFRRMRDRGGQNDTMRNWDRAIRRARTTVSGSVNPSGRAPSNWAV